jgi:hypothetical protein
MTEKKLIPRVGDRVIVKRSGKTHAGNVVTRMNEDGEWLIEVDGKTAGWYRHTDDFTVVDREPVEWPKGWEKATSVAGAVTWKGTESGVLLDRKRMERIVADGPYLLEHWDDLLDGDS